MPLCDSNFLDTHSRVGLVFISSVTNCMIHLVSVLEMLIKRTFELHVNL